VTRADSGLYCAAFTGACRRAGACFRSPRGWIPRSGARSPR
jgi:hypothetical protein